MNNKKWNLFLLLIPVGMLSITVVLAVLIMKNIQSPTENTKLIVSEEKNDTNQYVSSENGMNVTGSAEKGQEGNGSNVEDSSNVENPSNGGKESTTTVPLTLGTGINDTGILTEKGNGYEGIAGTGKYNYGEALQKALLFYELQRSGDLPEQTRCNWRGDSSLQDGKDAGLDLTGGWYDAGDNVKFNLPMAYTSSILGWSILESYGAYQESGQLEYALNNVRWANDYFMKCHPKDEVYYYQVGDGNRDHSFWGPAEVVEYKMERPSYYVDASRPGSTVCAQTAASLAICSELFEKTDKAYSKKALEHAKSLYEFARKTKSDSGYTMAAGFYDSHSGFYDELSWAGVWLYRETGEKKYLDQAIQDYAQADQNHKWALCWDDSHMGTAMLLAEITKEDKYKQAMEEHLDWWTSGDSKGDRITYTPKGLAWLDSWGSLRYATTTGFLATVYADWSGCDSAKSKKYWEFAEKQLNYALGDTGKSFVVGYGENAPQNPHHRTAQGSYCDNMNEPSVQRHTLYGALVGGPDASDQYRDEVSNYTNNEVACDYNAGFTALLAKMYGKYHGKTIKDFGAVEEIDSQELYVSGGINVEGQDFVEIRVYVCNTSSWPARVPKNLEYRYFVDLSEVYEDGGTADDIVVSSNYMQGGSEPRLICFNEEKHIYYMSVDFSDTLIFPGGQDAYKKEIQIRMRNTHGNNSQGVWDNDNDPSFVGMKNGGNELLTSSALYEDGKLVFGSEPNS